VETAKRTILYIEDDPASRRLVERTLTFSGYQVLVAERGLQGVDLARQHQPDLILTDINLPDLSGQEIATTLRQEERFATIPIVALTAQSQGSADWEMALAAGINGYLTKPLNIEALPSQLEYYLGGGRDQIDAERLAAAQTKYTREVVKRLETRIRELEKVNQDLIEMDKIKDTFIQITAHELRTPLTLVYGYTRLLEDHALIKAVLTADSDLKPLLAGLTDSVERLQGLIDEIVTISRIMTDRIDLKLVQVNTALVLRKVLQNFAKALQERMITVEYDVQEWPHDVRADKDLLQLVITNLVSNAIKYTPNNGKITIKASHDLQQFRFSVRDTGVGVPKDKLIKIFDRFHVTHDFMLHSTSKTAFGGGGLGLGLAICKGVIDAHGGKIWCESDGYDPEKCPGSVFHITMPMISVNAGRRVQV
jgi:signal transduction histidine kinase